MWVRNPELSIPHILLCVKSRTARIDMIFLWSEGCSCVSFELVSFPASNRARCFSYCLYVSFLPFQRLGPTCLIDWNFCCVQWVCAADTSLLVLRRDFPFTDQGTVKIKARLNFGTGNRKWGEEFPSAAEYSLFSELLTRLYVKMHRKCCSAVE